MVVQLSSKGFCLWVDEAAKSLGMVSLKVRFLVTITLELTLASKQSVVSCFGKPKLKLIFGRRAEAPAV